MDSVLSYVLPLASTALSACLIAMFKHLANEFGASLKKLHETTTANNEATFVILKERIHEMCKKYQAQGYIPANEADILQTLFKQYVAMGGNGYVAKQVEITLELPQQDLK